MSFFKDIKNQSQGAREIMFLLSTIITVSLVGMIWFRSFEKNIYVMLNPDREAEQKFFAGGRQKFGDLYAKNDSAGRNLPSLFSNLSQTGRDLKAAALGLFNFKNKIIETPLPAELNQPETPAKAYLLPVAGKK